MNVDLVMPSRESSDGNFVEKKLELVGSTSPFKTYNISRKKYSLASQSVVVMATTRESASCCPTLQNSMKPGINHVMIIR